MTSNYTAAVIVVTSINRLESQKSYLLLIDVIKIVVIKELCQSVQQIVQTKKKCHFWTVWTQLQAYCILCNCLYVTRSCDFACVVMQSSFYSYALLKSTTVLCVESRHHLSAELPVKTASK